MGQKTGVTVMGETKEILTAIMGGLRELSAEVKGLSDEVKHNSAKIEGLISRVDGLEAVGKESNERLAKIEERLDQMHDRKGYLLEEVPYTRTTQPSSVEAQ